jgi:hypothetical protein
MPQDQPVIVNARAHAAIYAKRVCILGTDEQEVTVPAGANAVPYGVVQGGEDEDFAAEDFIGIAIAGIVEVEAGTGGITKGAYVYVVDTGGKVADVPATAGTWNVVGICTKAAADGDIGEILIDRMLKYVAP